MKFQLGGGGAGQLLYAILFFVQKIKKKGLRPQTPIAFGGWDQLLYANFSAPLLLASAPSLHLFWQRHWSWGSPQPPKVMGV